MDKQTQKKSDFSTYTAIAVTCLLAFAGAYCTLTDNGILSTFMLLIPCAAGAAFVKLDFRIKLAAFVGFGYILNSLYNSTAAQSAVSAIMCGFVITVIHWGIVLLRRKGILYKLTAAALIASSLICHILVFGNPVSAVSSRNSLEAYVNEHYNTDSCRISRVYYNTNEKCFAVDINYKDEVTNVFTICDKGTYIKDGFGKYTEIQLMKEARLDIQLALREAFPEGRFTVLSDFIGSYPKGLYDKNDKSDYTSAMRFKVIIPSEMPDAEFERLVLSYHAIISKSGLTPFSITYYGGKAGYYFRKISLRMTCLPQNTVPEYIHPYNCKISVNEVLEILE